MSVQENIVANSKDGVEGYASVVVHLLSLFSSHRQLSASQQKPVAHVMSFSRTYIDEAMSASVDRLVPPRTTVAGPRGGRASTKFSGDTSIDHFTCS